jgi:hypothetical protein
MRSAWRIRALGFDAACKHDEVFRALMLARLIDIGTLQRLASAWSFEDFVLTWQLTRFCWRRDDFGRAQRETGLDEFGAVE